MLMVCWLLQVSEQYCNASLCWVQEEHKNMGAWSYVQPRTQTAIGGYHRYYIFVCEADLEVLMLSVSQSVRSNIEME